MTPSDLQARLDGLAALAKTRLGVSGNETSSVLQLAGGDLPRRERLAARRLAEQAALAENPKLARRLDIEVIETDIKRVERHLRRIDPREAAANRWAGVLGSIAFRLLVVLILLGVVLVWQDLI